MKLSKTQQECLDHLKHNKTFLYYMEYMGRFRPNAYYFADKTMKRFRENTVRKLIELEYIEIYESDGYGKHKARLKNSVTKSKP